MKIHQRFATLALLSWLAALVTRAEETAVVKEQNVNVRGQPSFQGEVITQLKQGEKVVVLEEISVSNPKKGEPAKWAKIQMPADTPVWVHAMFLDTETKTVKPNRLNLRAGPGENYSVVGRLQRGDHIKEIRTVNDWVEIETPPGAYAFVAASLLSKGVPLPAADPPVAKVEKSEPAVTPPAASIPVAPVIEKPEPVTEKAVPTDTPLAAVVETKPVPQPAPTEPEPDVVSPRQPETAAEPQPPPKRVVRREGVVRGTVSIQAPTYFELVGSESKRVITYLHLNQELLDKLQTNLKGFKDYVGRVVVVTGEEGIDPRWPRTPVIEVESLKLAL